MGIIFEVKLRTAWIAAPLHGSQRRTGGSIVFYFDQTPSFFRK